MAAIKILSAQIQAFIALKCGQVSGGFVQLKLGCWLLSVKKHIKSNISNLMPAQILIFAAQIGTNVALKDDTIFSYVLKS